MSARAYTVGRSTPSSTPFTNRLYGATDRELIERALKHCRFWRDSTPRRASWKANAYLTRHAAVRQAFPHSVWLPWRIRVLTVDQLLALLDGHELIIEHAAWRFEGDFLCARQTFSAHEPSTAAGEGRLLP